MSDVQQPSEKHTNTAETTASQKLSQEAYDHANAFFTKMETGIPKLANPSGFMTEASLAEFLYKSPADDPLRDVAKWAYFHLNDVQNLKIALPYGTQTTKYSPGIDREDVRLLEDIVENQPRTYIMRDYMYWRGRLSNDRTDMEVGLALTGLSAVFGSWKSAIAAGIYSAANALDVKNDFEQKRGAAGKITNVFDKYRNVLTESVDLLP